MASLFSKKDTQKISAGIIPSKKQQSLLAKLLLWIRGNFFIPDARVSWVKPSVLYLKKYIQENHVLNGRKIEEISSLFMSLMNNDNM